MRTPVVAIGLDAADPELLEGWMADGHLPNLSRLRSQGGYGRLTNIEYYKAETPWTTFLSGCTPDTIGYWTPVKFFEGTYKADEIEAYDFEEYPPFYALGEDYRVAVFDVPQTALSKQVNGRQVLAWGAHSPQTPSHSEPPELFDEITKKFGSHPSLHKDHGSWWSKKYLKFLHEASITGIERRVKVCRDWLQQENWDLFLTIFGEPHSVGHDFWHLSRPDHPLYGKTPVAEGMGDDPMLDVFRHIDRAIGEIIDAAPENSYVTVFAVHGSGNNVTDVASMVFLPEIMYRLNFPGKVALAPGRAGDPVPPVLDRPKSGNWPTNLWKEHRYIANPLRRFLRDKLPRRIRKKMDDLLGPLPTGGLTTYEALKAKGQKLAWQPTMWYQPLWPQMKAFALPSFSEGYIRLNVKGREPSGIVEPEDYETTCDSIAAEIEQLINPRTGRPIVKKILRPRASAADQSPGHPDADLIVLWDDEPTDVVDHPTLGRIGPIPYRRTGSHRARGFWIVNGPGIQAGSEIATSDAINLPPTILDLMGAPIPEHLQGKPILATRADEIRQALV